MNRYHYLQRKQKQDTTQTVSTSVPDGSRFQNEPSVSQSHEMSIPMARSGKDTRSKSAVMVFSATEFFAPHSRTQSVLESQPCCDNQGNPEVDTNSWCLDPPESEGSDTEEIDDDMFRCQVEEMEAPEVDPVPGSDANDLYELIPENEVQDRQADVNPPRGPVAVGKSFFFSGITTGMKGLNFLRMSSREEERRSEQQTGTETKDLVMNKLRSVWNNVKFGWNVRMKANFSPTVPIYLLGRCYAPRGNHMPMNDAHGKPYLPYLEAFFRDYSSRLWFTYRDKFQPLPLPPLTSAPDTVRTSDCGWGCMLRVGQMLLAQTLLVHFLGREWSYYGSNNPVSDKYHRQIVRWFGDSPHPTSPFSLHQMVRLSGKRPGEWYGPATVCRLLHKLVAAAAAQEPRLGELDVYLAQDRVIYREDILALASGCNRRGSVHTGSLNWSSSIPDADFFSTSSNSAGSGVEQGEDATDADAHTCHWRAVLILIPLHLGGADRFNPVYKPVLHAMLAHPTCVGVMGGRPRHSVLLVGCQEDRVIYLDPHYCQDTLEMDQPYFPLHTYHCMFPRTMPFRRLDPSCAVGFYCRTRADLESWLLAAAGPLSSNTAYPLLEVRQGSRPSTDQDELDSGQTESMRLRVHRVQSSGGRTEVNEFVFL